MSDLIAAIATGSTATAIGIVRVSGDGCFAACDRVFRPRNGVPFAQQPSHKMVFGEMLDDSGAAIDQGLAVRFGGGHSYTGEDSAEFHCHGSPVVLHTLLSALFAAGARQAQAGEFTKRAFLAGKLDLTGVEAVADLIESQSAAAAKNAASLLQGGISRPIRQMREKIFQQLTHFYAVCDYPDEDLDPFVNEEARKVLEECTAELDKLYQGFQRGRVLKEGLPVTILGRPNVGKSSLLNSLAGYERAIVTDEAGTTRDVVTESVRCGDTVLRLSDTAGLRETSSQAEKMGIDKARESARESRLVLCVFDGSSPLTEEDREVMETAQGLERAAILNKWDKGALDFPEVEQAFPKVFRLSAKTGEGVSELCQWLAGLTQGEGETLVTSARQAALLGKAAESCRMAAQSAAMGFTADAFLADGEEAVRLLDEVLVDAVSEDIVHGIFSRFCVGK